MQCHLALGARFAPLALLRRHCGRVRLELRQLAAERLHGAVGLLTRGRGPLQPFVRRAKAAGDVGLLHLPVHPLLARRFLLGLELGEPAAPAPELLVEAAAREVALDERGVDLGQALLRPGQPLGHAQELRLRLGHLAGQVAGQPDGVLAGGGRLALRLARLIGGSGGRRERVLPFGEPAGRGVHGRLGRRQRPGRALDLLRQGRELGPAAERARRRGGA